MIDLLVYELERKAVHRDKRQFDCKNVKRAMSPLRIISSIYRRGNEVHLANSDGNVKKLEVSSKKIQINISNVGCGGLNE